MLTRLTFFKSMAGAIAAWFTPKSDAIDITHPMFASADKPMYPSIVRGDWAKGASAVTVPTLVRYSDAQEESANAQQHQVKQVILNGNDITKDCFRVEEYSDGTIRAFCYVKRDGEFALNDWHTEVQKEIRTGVGTVSMLERTDLLPRNHELTETVVSDQHLTFGAGFSEILGIREWGVDSTQDGIGAIHRANGEFAKVTNFRSVTVEAKPTDTSSWKNRVPVGVVAYCEDDTIWVHVSGNKWELIYDPKERA